MPTPEEIAAKLKRRNQSINKVDKKKAKKIKQRPRSKVQMKKKITRNSLDADPGLTLQDRTKAAIRSRARRGKLSAADKRLAKREKLNIADLF